MDRRAPALSGGHYTFSVFRDRRRFALSPALSERLGLHSRLDPAVRFTIEWSNSSARLLIHVSERTAQGAIPVYPSTRKRRRAWMYGTAAHPLRVLRLVGPLRLPALFLPADGAAVIELHHAPRLGRGHRGVMPLGQPIRFRDTPLMSVHARGDLVFNPAASRALKRMGTKRVLIRRSVNDQRLLILPARPDDPDSLHISWIRAERAPERAVLMRHRPWALARSQRVGLRAGQQYRGRYDGRRRALVFDLAAPERPEPFFKVTRTARR